MDLASREPKKDLKTATAVLTPAVLTMIADGRVDPAELAQLCGLCALHPLYAGFTPEELIAIIRSVLLQTSHYGSSALASAAAENLSGPLRETAMCFAMRVALADGSLAESEKETVAGMASALKLAPDSFAKILEVTAMMQRSSAA